MSDYKVYVDDNFHFMNEEERYLQGIYNNFEDAAAAAMKVIDGFLESHASSDMTPEQLFHGWTSMGDSPFIVASDRQQNQERMNNVIATIISVEKQQPASSNEFLAAFDRIYKPPSNSFSASDYARQRCRELCGSKPS